ncbi:MAG: fused MFS/spermidine synthase [Alphaproteobacteria bacterium]|nr:MAG: fused MFS/spermidine synthase [Alphaproteobacteria bacterium]
MAGRILLPMLGGSPATWLTAMAFFQMALLAGYALAWGLSTLTSPRGQAAVILGLLAAGLLLMPPTVPKGWVEELTRTPALAVVTALAAAFGLPFVVMSTLSATLQRLYAQTTQADPYFLFAASNLGSFTGLLIYPLVIENMIGLSNQSAGWGWGYAALILLVASCLGLSLRQGKDTCEALHQSPTIRYKQDAIPLTTKLRWLWLAFLPSSLMLGVTSSITTDVGSFPLLWVMPLALYLLTFVLAFGKKIQTHDGMQFIEQPFFAALQFWLLFLFSGGMAPGWWAVPWQLAAFASTALMCHRLLAQEHPDAKHLTLFYFYLALGGALGGSFNAFLAPILFPLPIEYPIILALACAMHPGYDNEGTKKSAVIFGLALIPLSLGAAAWAFLGEQNQRFMGALIAGTLALTVVMNFTLCLSQHRRRWSITCLLVVLLTISVVPQRVALHIERNFFGVMRVEDKQIKGIPVRELLHGTTLHGTQGLTAEYEHEPISYYHRSGPVGDVFDVLQNAHDIGIIGLGAGGLACYTAPGRHFTYYEIDPAVETVARQWFSNFRNCGPAEVKIGDGRKLLELATDTQHDLIILDAFSSDAIPVHLLTQEAFSVYRQRLAPNGMIVVHISNRYFKLGPPIATVAKQLGMSIVLGSSLKKTHPLMNESIWVALSDDFSQLQPLRERGWKEIGFSSQERPWSDDYAPLLPTLMSLNRK